MADSHSKEKKTLSIDELKMGMPVFVSKLNQEGTVLSISKDSKVQIQLALGKMFFNIEDLELSSKQITNNNSKKTDYSSRKDFKAKAISSEINAGLIVLLITNLLLPLILALLDIVKTFAIPFST